MPSTSTDLLEVIGTIANIITPLMVLALTGIGWRIRSKFERAKELEEKLRDDRVEIYFNILEPFIMMFTKGDPPNKHRGKTYSDIGAEMIPSLEYKKAAFQLSLFGSDEVLRAYNDLMQFFFEDSQNQLKHEEKLVKTISLFGRLMLEIRKNVGNENTSLERFEMLEFLITDLRKFQIDGKYPNPES